MRAENVAEFSFREVFATSGFVRYKLADRGKASCNDAAKSLATRIGINKRCATPYRRQANGVAQRTPGEAAGRPPKSARDAGLNCVERPPATPMAIGTSINFSTGSAPSFLLSGWDSAPPTRVALNGVQDIDGDELEAEFARGNANRKAAGNNELELEKYVFN